MFARVNRLVAVTALVLSAAAAAVAGVATAAPGPGTFTSITTPSHNITIKWTGANKHITVSGHASHDVTTVDIDCIYLLHEGPFIQHFATGVAVTGGSFATVATVSSVPTTCRMRAIPTGIDPQHDYIGSYTGPLLFAYGIELSNDSGKTVGFEAIDEVGSGIGALTDASMCAVAIIATLLMPEVELRGPASQQCAFGLPASNITNTGTPTAAAIRVDGKNAYLPGSVKNFLRGDLALTLTQTSITTQLTRHSNGDITVTESSPLKRCSGDNTYPPTSVSCASLVSTGVTFKRVLDFIRGAHQVEIRDSYISTDGHAHSVSAQYQCIVATGGTGDPSNGTGAPGYIYPGHASAFKKATLDKVVTGFPSRPATVLVRSDIYASSFDEQADTQAYTWSRHPSKIQFSHTSTSQFALPYSFSVPAHGSASVRFAESEAPLTSDAKKLAAKAVADF